MTCQNHEELPTMVQGLDPRFIFPAPTSTNSKDRLKSELVEKTRYSFKDIRRSMQFSKTKKSTVEDMEFNNRAMVTTFLPDVPETAPLSFGARVKVNESLTESITWSIYFDLRSTNISKQEWIQRWSVCRHSEDFIRLRFNLVNVFSRDHDVPELPGALSRIKDFPEIKYSQSFLMSVEKALEDFLVSVASVPGLWGSIVTRHFMSPWPVNTAYGAVSTGKEGSKIKTLDPSSGQTNMEDEVTEVTPHSHKKEDDSSYIDNSSSFDDFVAYDGSLTVLYRLCTCDTQKQP